MRECPLCSGVELVPYPAGEGLDVDYCSSCRGLWCDAGEFEKLVNGPLSKIVPLPFSLGEPAGPPCPSCRSQRLHGRPTVGEGPAIELFDCSGCRGTWLDGGVLPQLKSLLQARRRQEARDRPPPKIPKPRPEPEPFNLADEIPYDSLPIQAATLPIAIAFGFLVASASVPFLRFFFNYILHEFGHTIAAWLSGIKAVPVLYGGFTSTDLTRTTSAKVAVLVVLVALFGFAWRERKRFEAAVAGMLCVVQVYMTFILAEDEARMWISYSGLAGEIFLSTWILIGFYYPKTGRLRWDFWRFVAIFPAAIAYCSSVLLWLRATKDLTQLPMGAAVGPESNGDLNRLIDQWGWTPPEIAKSYLSLTFLCGLVILGHYLFFLWRAWVKDLSE